MGKRSSRSSKTILRGNAFALDFVRHDWREITEYLHPCKIYKKGREHPLFYLNVSTAFDIEVTSFFRNKETMEIMDVKKAESIKESVLRKSWEKIAVMYAWVFAYDGHAFTGRTWDEFQSLLKIIKEYHGLSSDRIMVCGVHNLAYEFAFIAKRFQWTSVFAVKERTPVYARTDDGIEFRCTLLLSGYSLAKVGEHLQKYPVEKKLGDLDYLKLRHCKTPLSNEEWGYIVNDGLIVCAYLQELIEENQRIVRIPLTKTGFVRKYLRKKCYFGDKNNHRYDLDNTFKSYRRIILACQITGKEEYLLLKEAFTGAIVHCNTLSSNLLIENVRSMDETSAYPTQIAIGFFPFGKGEWIMPKNKGEFDRYISKKACLMDVSFYNIEKTQMWESIISISKCKIKEDYEEDNGRLIKAKRIRIVITEVDYSVFRMFYKWSKMTIHRMMVYEKRRLPTRFVEAVLDLYATKTELKGVDGKESEYMHAKENINSVYGCCVTDICQNKHEYIDGEWVETPCDIDKELERYNFSENRFHWYHIGVWVTSLARRALASAIYAIGKNSDTIGGDYIYSDTDSVKFRNPEKHQKYFDQYNAWMIDQLKKASQFHQIPLEKFMPKTIKGEEKPLGVWDFDGDYKRFKSLGAKRYAVEYPEEHTITLKDGTKYKTFHSLTIAGVNKSCAIPYIEKHEKDFFDFMHFDYLFTTDCCGKNLHTYIDDEKSGSFVDYLGNVSEFHELSGVHIMATTYKMTASDDYLSLLDCITSTYTII